MRAPIRKLPSYHTLHALLTYDEKTGILRWRTRTTGNTGRGGDGMFNAKYAGQIAGGLSMGRPDGSNRYWVVGLRVDGKYQQYGAHRIIWKMMTGDEPLFQIDHEDGDELNNRWHNLRPAVHGQNIQNSKLRKDNKSGIKGVCWDKWHKSWTVQISVDGKNRRLGRFKSLEEAARVISETREQLHGNFARHQ